MQIQEYEIMYKFESDYWWYVGLHELILSFIKNKNKYSLNILDAGCGTGKMLELLQNYNAEGFDFSNEAIKFCQKRGLTNTKIQDLNTWESEKSYDVIISADVICSKGLENYFDILKKFYRALNENGILILNLPAFECLRRNHDNAVNIAKRFRLNPLKKELRQVGFKIEYSTYRLPHLFFIIYFNKIYQKIFKTNESNSDLKNLPMSINDFFLFLNRIENWFYKYWNNSVLGSSVFVVATKK